MKKEGLHLYDAYKRNKAEWEKSFVILKITFDPFYKKIVEEAVSSVSLIRKTTSTFFLVEMLKQAVDEKRDLNSYFGSKYRRMERHSKKIETISYDEIFLNKKWLKKI